jgi:pilus assembly protein Flp/PilA
VERVLPDRNAADHDHDAGGDFDDPLRAGYGLLGDCILVFEPDRVSINWRSEPGTFFGLSNWKGAVPMTPVFQRVLRFLASEDGPTAVEYAVMLAMIIMVCVGAVQALGINTAAKYQEMANKMPTGS